MPITKQQSRLIKVPVSNKLTEQENNALEDRREKNLEIHANFIKTAIQMNEEDMLDIEPGKETMQRFIDLRQRAETLSKIFFWLAEVKKSRFTAKRVQEEQAKKAALKPEDAARLELPVEPGKLIEMP